MRWLAPYKTEEITDKELHQFKCVKSRKLLKQALSSLQLKAYVDHSNSNVCIPYFLEYRAGPLFPSVVFYPGLYTGHASNRDAVYTVFICHISGKEERTPGMSPPPNAVPHTTHHGVQSLQYLQCSVSFAGAKTMPIQSENCSISEWVIEFSMSRIHLV